MSDAHGLQFNVDASGIARGLDAYKSAVNGIFSSLKSFEAQATKTFAAVAAAANNKSNLASYAKSLQALGNINIDTSAARKITQLSTAISGFKAPSNTQAAALTTFFRSLSRIPDISGAAGTLKTISNLSGALAGFKAPSQAQSAALVAFAQAMQRAMPALSSIGNLGNLAGVSAEIGQLSNELKNLRPPSAGQITNLGNLGMALRSLGSNNVNGLSRIGTAISGISNFKAPTPAQIRNLSQFISAIDNLKVPQNAGAIANALNQITQAATRSNAALGGLRGSLPGLTSNLGRTASGAHGTRVEMMGLQNAFSGTFQAGSVLRSLLGSLTLGELGRAFFDANQTANQFASTMEVISQSPGFSDAMWSRVSAQADHFGTSLSTYAESYSKFAVAAHEAGASLNQTDQIFTGFQTAMTAMHLGTQQQQSVGLALREMLDRGYVSTQQLTRQLGLVLPGAVVTLAKSVKEATLGQETLWDALKKKQVDSTQALLILSKYYTTTFGPSLAQALQSPTQQFNILKNRITELMIAIGNDGAKKAFADLLAQISSYLKPEDVAKFARAISDGLVTALQSASNALRYLHDNWDSIKGPLTTALKLMGEWMALTTATSFIKMGAGPFLALSQGLGGIRTVMGGLTGTTAATRAGFVALTNGMQPLNSGLGGLGRLGTAMAGSFTLLNTNSRVANVGLVGLNGGMNLLRGGVNIGTNALSGLVNFLGGPWGIAFIAATTAIAYFANQWVSMSAHISSTHAMIDRAAEDIQQVGLASHAAGIGIDGVGSFAAGASPHIQQLAKDAGFATTQLYQMAQAARTASLVKLQGDLVDNRKQAGTLENDTRDGILKNLHGAADQGLFPFMGELGHGIAAGTKRLFTGGQSEKDTQGAIQANDKSARDLITAIGKEIAKPLKDWAPEGLLPDSNKPLVGAGQGDKNGAAKAFNQEKSFETAWDALMTKLDAGDPIAKLNDQFTQMLESGEKLLLNQSGFNAANKVVGDGSTSAAAKVQAVIDQLRSGNLTDVAKKAMAKSGQSIQDMIEAFMRAKDTLDDKIKESTQKSLENTFKGLDKGLAALGDKNPYIKQLADNNKSVNNSAQQLLSPDSYTQWGTARKAKPLDDQSGTESLIASLKAGGGDKDVLDSLSAEGISLKDVTDSLQQNLAARQALALEKKQDQTFGASVIKQMQNENTLLGLSNTQQQVYKNLQDAVNEAKKNGLDITQQSIDATRTQIEQLQQQNELLQKTKDLHDNNGVRQWAADTWTAADAVQNLDKDALTGLENTLEKLGTTGTFSIKSLLSSLQGDLVKYASQSLTKNIVNGIHPGEFDPKTQAVTPNGNWSPFGKILGNAANDPTKSLTADQRAGRETSAMWTAVYDGTGALRVVMKSAPGGSTAPTTDKFSGKAVPGKVADPVSAMSATIDPVTNSLRVSIVGQGLGGQSGLAALTGGTTPGTGGGAAAYGGLGALFNSTGTYSSGIGSSIAGGNGGFDSTGISTDGMSMDTSKSMSSLMSSLGSATTGLQSLGNTAQNSGGLLGGLVGGLGKLLGIGGGSGGGGGLLGGLLGGGKSGGGGLLGGITGLFKSNGLTGMAGLSSFLGFREGGISGQGVGAGFSAGLYGAGFSRAPHFADGTPHTGNFAGGMPSILHQNEAVVPLSRGRAIPIEFSGNGAMAGSQAQGGGSQHITFNVTSPNPDTFRKSQSQLATQAYAVGAKAARRNMG